MTCKAWSARQHAHCRSWLTKTPHFSNFPIEEIVTLKRSSADNAIFFSIAHQNRGAVCTNWPTKAGNLGLDEKIGASVVKPLGLQKPLVVQSVRGHSIFSSRIILKMLWYCTRRVSSGLNQTYRRCTSEQPLCTPTRLLSSKILDLIATIDTFA